MHEQLNQHIAELILTVAGILAILARNWLKELKLKALAYLEQRTNAEQRKLLAILGKEAFSFAETVYRELKGSQKMEKAAGYLEERAKALGLSITTAEAQAAIEAAWIDAGKNNTTTDDGK
jgi:hypothetical protein